MEEAKDLRELKSLLSGLPLQDNTGHSPGYRETGAVDASAQKIALLKSASVFLFSVSLFLSLLLVFLLVRVYIIGPADKDRQQKVAQPPVPEEVPAVTAPAPVLTAPPPAPALPTVNQAVLNEPALAGKDEPPAEKKDPPVKKEEPPPAAVLKEAGGSLYFVALKHYGKADETMFDLILQANPAITDVRKIDDYQKIILPEITAESFLKGSPQDGYRVHVGTFETSQWAELYAASMKRKGKQVYIESRQFSPLDTWYRLTIGDFANKEEALQTVQSLQTRGLIYIPPQTE
jgi:phage tail protein X